MTAEVAGTFDNWDEVVDFLYDAGATELYKGKDGSPLGNIADFHNLSRGNGSDGSFMVHDTDTPNVYTIGLSGGYYVAAAPGADAGPETMYGKRRSTSQAKQMTAEERVKRASRLKQLQDIVARHQANVGQPAKLQQPPRVAGKGTVPPSNAREMQLRALRAEKEKITREHEVLAKKNRQLEAEQLTRTMIAKGLLAESESATETRRLCAMDAPTWTAARHLVETAPKRIDDLPTDVRSSRRLSTARIALDQRRGPQPTAPSERTASGDVLGDPNFFED
jgi:hypothetical protein